MKYKIAVLFVILAQVVIQAKTSTDMLLLIDAMDKIKEGISHSNYENVEIGVERVQSLLSELRPDDGVSLTQNPELDEIDRLSESLKSEMKKGDTSQAEDRYVRIVNSCVTCHDEEKPSPVYHYFSKNLAWQLVR